MPLQRQEDNVDIWFWIMVFTGIPLIILAFLGLLFLLDEQGNKGLREYYEKQWDKDGDKDV